MLRSEARLFGEPAIAPFAARGAGAPTALRWNLEGGLINGIACCHRAARALEFELGKKTCTRAASLPREVEEVEMAVRRFTDG